MRWEIVKTELAKEPMYYVIVVQANLKPIAGEPPFGPFTDYQDAVNARERLMRAIIQERVYN